MFTLPGDITTRGALVGATYGTMGIASLIMPTLMGILSDRFINAERVLGACHIIGAIILVWASTITDPNLLYFAILLNSFFFMPTIALNNTVSYSILTSRGIEVQKVFPPIRVWGTVGFIIAMWGVDLLDWTKSPNQFLFAAAAGFIMGIYSLSIKYSAQYLRRNQ